MTNDQMSTPSDLFVFSYVEVKLSQCVYCNSRVGNNKWVFVNRIVRLPLLVFYDS